MSQPTAREVVLNRARELQAPTYLKGRDFRCRRFGDRQFSFFGRNNTWRSLESGLTGRHQVENAALVLAACETMMEHDLAKLPDNAIRSGLAKTRWPGRLEVVSSRPLVILDGAHNLMAARKLAHHLKERYNDKKIILVIGVLDDKAAEPILKDLIAPCHQVVVTQPLIERAIPAQDLAAIARKYAADVLIIPEVGAAVKKTLKHCGTDDVVCVAGSLYVVGEAKTALREIDLE